MCISLNTNLYILICEFTNFFIFEKCSSTYLLLLIHFIFLLKNINAAIFIK